jgi:hypothetical protein
MLPTTSSAGRALTITTREYHYFRSLLEELSAVWWASTVPQVLIHSVLRPATAQNPIDPVGTDASCVRVADAADIGGGWPCVVHTCSAGGSARGAGGNERRLSGPHRRSAHQGWLGAVRAGPTGGHQLVADLATVSLLDLIEAVEGPTDDGRCVMAAQSCPAPEPCAVHETWVRARAALTGELAATSLASITSRAAGANDHTVLTTRNGSQRRSAGRHTPCPSNRCAIAQAIPVARLFASVAFGPDQPPFTVSWKTCSQRSNNSGVKGSASWR